MALKFFVGLPKEARDALRQIEALVSKNGLNSSLKFLEWLHKQFLFHGDFCPKLVFATQLHK